ncbi:MAG TPA: hypothetical protein ENN29_12325 [Candidatus Hydrogenedentes bacterium]|nr:hypothetical protein [Candidatus Hydrogenedentota bacterium]
MAELWDVAAHVENHPDDYPQRWRLAKKLYSAREYRLALEHLNVLKNEWTPKLNVRRYLAATYFRLGRYPEAISELEEAIGEWPDEIGIREQLAYVLKADKQLEKALDAWEQVLRLQPDHAIGQKSVVRLKALLAGDARNQDAPTKIDPVIIQEENVPTPPPMPGMECPKCGAQNSEEFGDCWRCGKPLPHAKFGISDEAAHDFVEQSLPIRSETLGRIAVIATLGLLLYALFLSIRIIVKYNEGVETLTSLSQVYDYDLVPARIAAGLVMLLSWPVVLRLIIRLFRAKPRPKASHTYIGGSLLGAFALAMMLIPMPAMLLTPAIAILLFLALTVVMVAFQMNMGMALAVWAAHFAVMFVLGAAAFWTTEIYQYGSVVNPVGEVMAVRQFARDPGENGDGKPVRLPSVITPIRDKAKWFSSGSLWLDEKISQITITLRLEEESPGLRFQIYEEGILRFHEDIGEKRNESFTYPVVPGTEYEFVVAGEDNLIVQVVIQSVLPFQIIE